MGFYLEFVHWKWLASSEDGDKDYQKIVVAHIEHGFSALNLID